MRPSTFLLSLSLSSFPLPFFLLPRPSPLCLPLCSSLSFPILSYESLLIMRRFFPSKNVPCAWPHGQQRCSVPGPAQPLPFPINSLCKRRDLAAECEAPIAPLRGIMALLAGGSNPVGNRRGKARWNEETTLNPMSPTTSSVDHALRLQNRAQLDSSARSL